MSTPVLNHAEQHPLREPELDPYSTTGTLHGYMGDVNPSIMRHLEQIPSVAADTDMLRVLQVFREHQQEHFFPVIEADGRPLGLVRERELKRLVYSRYGQALLENKSTPKTLEQFLTFCPVAELDTPSSTLLAQVQGQEGGDGVIVTGQGRYLGFLRTHALVELAHQEQLALASEHNKVLKQKNADIQSVLDNMRQGICSILPDLTVHPDYSAHLRQILETEAIAERPVMEVLFRNCRLGADGRHRLEAAMTAILGEDELAFELNTHQLPSELTFAAESASKALELHWTPVIGESGSIEKLMLVVRDVTAMRGLQQRAQRQQRELERIGHILGAGDAAFTGFLASAQRLLAVATADLEAVNAVNEALLNALYRPMHTLKGNARTLGFTPMADAVHVFEQQLEALRGVPQAAPEPLRATLASVGAELHAYKALYREHLQGFTADRSLLERLRNWARAERDGFDYDRFLRLLARLEATRLQDCLDRLERGLARVAGELGKPAPLLDVTGGDLSLSPEHAERLENILGHVLRNALDHGIETPAERERAGKARRGCLRIQAWQEAGRLRVEVSDDGAGLGMERLRAKAAAAGLVIEAGNDECLAELAFRSGLSTAAEVSQISGRGVGLDAVRHDLRAVGGDVRIVFTAPRQGDRRAFKLCLDLPA